MQLQAFLRSYQQHVSPLTSIAVLYLATSERHARAYADVLAQFAFVVAVPQRESFKETLLSVLTQKPFGRSEGNVVFFVDDQIFIRPWTVLEEPGLSLRLGLHLTREYAYNDAPQPLPPYVNHFDGRVRWRWGDGAYSWGYPLSVDGHVFESTSMRRMLESVDFHSPNTLESALQVFEPFYAQRYGTCYRKSKVVNVPWNLVQSDWSNRHSSAGPIMSMLEWWEAGKQIHLNHIDGVLNESVHQEFPLMLEDR